MAGLNQVPIADFRREGLLSVVTYENGTKGLVNYGYEPADAEGITVPARSYAVRKEGGT